LDEVWKANSAILNSMLTAINERKFDNNGDKPMDIPLLTCFGASNELPQGEELGALYDRFLMRYWVKEIQDDDNFADLLTGNIGNDVPSAVLTLDDINELHKMLDSIDISKDMINNIRKIQHDLKGKGVTASDRRWKSAVTVLKAIALLRGMKEVTGDELETLGDMLWHKPEDRRVILEAVSPYGNPLNLKAIEYLDMATESFDKWRAAGNDNKEMEAIQAHKQIKEILKTIKAELHGRAESETLRLRETQKTLMGQLRTLTMKMMEVDDEDDDAIGVDEPYTDD